MAPNQRVHFAILNLQEQAKAQAFPVNLFEAFGLCCETQISPLEQESLIRNLSQKCPLMTDIIAELKGLRDCCDKYDLILCDVWGVLHNGLSAFEEACHALRCVKQENDVKIILLTNAPRPALWIARQLEELNISSDIYDGIVTSGDATRQAIEDHPASKIYALGPERDLNFYDDLDVRLVDAEEADLVSITGLVDDMVETPDDYNDLLRTFLDRGLEVICANPDIVVERGDQLIYCGGALAEKYREMGGTAFYFGKPKPAIYNRALTMGETLLDTKPLNKARVLAIGDGVMTDVRGAKDAGLDCLFITGGIHAAQNGPLEKPTIKNVTDFLKSKKLNAKFFMPKLTY